MKISKIIIQSSSRICILDLWSMVISYPRHRTLTQSIEEFTVRLLRSHPIQSHFLYLVKSWRAAVKVMLLMRPSSKSQKPCSLVICTETRKKPPTKLIIRTLIHLTIWFVRLFTEQFIPLDQIWIGSYK